MACTSIATRQRFTESKSLLDDIATALKNFPDLHVRIVGHTDSTGDPEHNVHLSLDRALAIEAALVERGVDPQRLVTAGLGESRPITSNATPEGRARNRRVELDRVTDSAEAKKMLKAMSDFLGAQKTLSVGFDTVFEVVTPTHADRSEIGSCKLGNCNARPTGQDSPPAVRRVC
jgi:OmpA family